MSVQSVAVQRVQPATSTWLYHKQWDLTFIIFSAVLVPLPLIIYYQLMALGVSASNALTVINLLVALVVGGPHMYSTYTLTFADPNFRRRYPLFVAGAVLIPIGVISLAVFDLTILLTVFMFWASIHVLHQIAYLVDCYRAKQGEHGLWSRALDYAVIFSSLYPFATYRLIITNDFIIDEKHIQVPAFLRIPELVWLVWVFFFTVLALFIARTVVEARQGRLNVPKVLLMSVTIVLAFVVPTLPDLSVAFQGMNTWHSLQYLALVWYINKLRKERDEIGSEVVRGLAGEGRTWRFYLFHTGVTVLAGVVIGGVYFLSGLRLEQAYYIVVLSSLLVHYYVDHLLFTRVDNLVR